MGSGGGSPQRKALTLLGPGLEAGICQNHLVPWPLTPSESLPGTDGPGQLGARPAHTLVGSRGGGGCCFERSPLGKRLDLTALVVQALGTCTLTASGHCSPQGLYEADTTTPNPNKPATGNTYVLSHQGMISGEQPLGLLSTAHRPTSQGKKALPAFCTSRAFRPTMSLGHPPCPHQVSFLWAPGRAGSDHLSLDNPAAETAGVTTINIPWSC